MGCHPVESVLDVLASCFAGEEWPALRGIGLAVERSPQVLVELLAGQFGADVT